MSVTLVNHQGQAAAVQADAAMNTYKLASRDLCVYA